MNELNENNNLEDNNIEGQNENSNAKNNTKKVQNMKYTSLKTNNKAKKKKNLVIIVIIIIIIIFFLLIIINNNIVDKKVKKYPEDAITDDFSLCGMAGDEYYHACKKNSLDYMNIKVSEYDLPKNLYIYNKKIRFRITYSNKDEKIYNLELIDNLTNEIIEDVSEKNINKLYNLEYGKKIINKKWKEKIKLSTLNENEIYKFTADKTSQMPEIINDLGTNYILYIKEFKDISFSADDYEEEIHMLNSIESISISFNEFDKGESFNIMYKKINKSELLKKIEEDDIIYLSSYNDGDQISHEFEKYIYNDTNQNIIILTKDLVFGYEFSNSYTIKVGEIYGLKGVFDFINIEFENK